jgi:hypothetical protein
VSAMCSECQAPAEWHEYDLSLQLFLPPPPPNSEDESLARILPGWWERCFACTAYNIEHRWGGEGALSSFQYPEWRAMLPPLLRTLFAPPLPKPKDDPKSTTTEPLAVIKLGPIDLVMRRLAKAQAKYPTAQVRRGRGGRWELWPS